MDLKRRQAAGTVEERPRHIEVRPRHSAGFDRRLEPQLRGSLDAAHSAGRSHAVSQVESGRRITHLQLEIRRVVAEIGLEIWPRNIPEMVVHADHSRHDRVAAKVEYRGTVDRFHVRTR